MNEQNQTVAPISGPYAFSLDIQMRDGSNENMPTVTGYLIPKVDGELDIPNRKRLLRIETRVDNDANITFYSPDGSVFLSLTDESDDLIEPKLNLLWRGNENAALMERVRERVMATLPIVVFSHEYASQQGVDPETVLAAQLAAAPPTGSKAYRVNEDGTFGERLDAPSGDAFNKLN